MDRISVRKGCTVPSNQVEEQVVVAGPREGFALPGGAIHGGVHRRPSAGGKRQDPPSPCRCAATAPDRRRRRAATRRRRAPRPAWSRQAPAWGRRRSGCPGAATPSPSPPGPRRPTSEGSWGGGWRPSVVFLEILGNEEVKIRTPRGGRLKAPRPPRSEIYSISPSPSPSPSLKFCERAAVFCRSQKRLTLLKNIIILWYNVLEDILATILFSLIAKQPEGISLLQFCSFIISVACLPLPPLIFTNYNRIVVSIKSSFFSGLCKIHILTVPSSKFSSLFFASSFSLLTHNSCLNKWTTTIIIILLISNWLYSSELWSLIFSQTFMEKVLFTS